MMATQFSHNSFLYFKYIIRKGNGTFVSSAYLKFTKLFHTHTGQPETARPPLKHFLLFCIPTIPKIKGRKGLPNLFAL